jgi:hypothetical protein
VTKGSGGTGEARSYATSSLTVTSSNPAV